MVACSFRALLPIGSYPLRNNLSINAALCHPAGRPEGPRGFKAWTGLQGVGLEYGWGVAETRACRTGKLVGMVASFSIVTPDLIRGLALLEMLRKKAGSQVKPGMTGVMGD